MSPVIFPGEPMSSPRTYSSPTPMQHAMPSRISSYDGQPSSTTQSQSNRADSFQSNASNQVLGQKTTADEDNAKQDPCTPRTVPKHKRLLQSFKTVSKKISQKFILQEPEPHSARSLEYLGFFDPYEIWTTLNRLFICSHDGLGKKPKERPIKALQKDAETPKDEVADNDQAQNKLQVSNEQIKDKNAVEDEATGVKPCSVDSHGSHESHMSRISDEDGLATSATTEPSLNESPIENKSDSSVDLTGEDYWQERRKKWITPTKVTTPKPSLLKDVPLTHYPAIYDKLMKSTPLREPMNLVDALKIMRAGWVYSGQFSDEELWYSNGHQA